MCLFFQLALLITTTNRVCYIYRLLALCMTDSIKIPSEFPHYQFKEFNPSIK